MEKITRHAVPLARGALIVNSQAVSAHLLSSSGFLTLSSSITTFTSTPSAIASSATTLLSITAVTVFVSSSTITVSISSIPGQRNGGLSTATKAGIGIGSAAVFALVLLTIVVFVVWKRKEIKPNSAGELYKVDSFKVQTNHNAREIYEVKAHETDLKPEYPAELL